MATTKIEWADKVWNPVTGCTKVSEGCRNCYAKTLHDMRYKAYLNGKDMPPQYAVPFEQVQLHRDRYNNPAEWKKPSRIFVNSMSDLFHSDVSDSFISGVFLRMIHSRRHTFMVLTKRPERMKQWVSKFCTDIFSGIMPLQKNIWLGVTAENQQTADERIPLLLQTPAAKRFVSVEPMLGPVDLTHDLDGYKSDGTYGNRLDWVICGGETGTKARPMHPNWARSLRDQCQAADVPFFFKGWGEWELSSFASMINDFSYTGKSRKVTSINIPGAIGYNKCYFVWAGKKAAGRLLDGREWNEFPEVE